MTTLAPVWYKEVARKAARRSSMGLPRSVRLAKRTIDVAASAAVLLVFSPILPLIALFIYLDSPGPILYRQRRVKCVRGRDGRGQLSFSEFEMLKFRTMRMDAEKETGAVLCAENDPRVTRVGALLRKTRLDEVPQLLNVLWGDMSLCGPRPERAELFTNLALAIPFFEERMHDVKPGITGLAQISLGYSGRALPGTPVARYESTLTDPFQLDLAEPSEADDMRIKLLFDLAYVSALERFWTYLRMELLILLKTPWVMLRGIGR